MLIGILQTGHVPESLRAHSGAYPDMFEQLLAGKGLRFRAWSVVDMEFPEGPQEAEGWLITGSRHGAYEDLPFIPPLERFIRAAYGAGVPLVGICFGHQIIAQALGGRVEKFRGGWAIGSQDYDFNGETLKLNAWHQDQITVLPEGAEVIARNDFCPYAGLAYGDRAFSVQAHPEFTPEFLARLAEARGRGVVPQEQLDAALARLDEPLDADRIAARIADFFFQTRA